MRFVVVGDRPDGRSYIAHDGPPPKVTRRYTQVNSGYSGEVLNDVPDVLEPGQSAPALLIEPPSHQPRAIPFMSEQERVETYDLEIGGVRWTLGHIGPEVHLELHRTATLDMNTIVSGSVVIELDEGSAELRQGDAVLIPGCRHAWHTAAEGVVMSIVMTGLLPATPQP